MRRDAEGAKALLPRMNAGAPTEVPTHETAKGGRRRDQDEKASLRLPTLRQTNAAVVSFLSWLLGSGEWRHRQDCLCYWEAKVQKSRPHEQHRDADKPQDAGATREKGYGEPTPPWSSSCRYCSELASWGACWSLRYL